MPYCPVAFAPSLTKSSNQLLAGVHRANESKDCTSTAELAGTHCHVSSDVHAGPTHVELYEKFWPPTPLSARSLSPWDHVLALAIPATGRAVPGEPDMLEAR